MKNSYQTMQLFMSTGHKIFSKNTLMTSITYEQKMQNKNGTIEEVNTDMVFYLVMFKIYFIKTKLKQKNELKIEKKAKAPSFKRTIILE